MFIDYIVKILMFLLVISFFVVIYMVLCRSHTHFRGINPKEDKTFVNAFINRLYFVLVTVSTIGYGDIAPVTMRAKVVTICIIIFIFLIILKIFEKFVDVYKNNIHGYFTTLIGREGFVNSRGIECGLVLSEEEAKKECPLCCRKNDMIYGGAFTNKDNKSLCKCTEHDKFSLYNDSYMNVNPEIKKRTNGQIWYTGDMDVNTCIQSCNKDQRCRFFYVDPDKKCWNSDMDPSLASRTYKSGFFCGIKKNVK
jgi:hypothetical protein